MDGFPVSLVVEYRGLSRNAGSFERTNDQGASATVEFPSAYAFEYEDAQGVTRTLSLSERQLDQAAGFDIRSAQKGQRYTLVGTVMVRDGWVQPVSLSEAKPATRAA